jgi:MFS-type transporter involved in bile tolerance (Atg22 family)
MKWILGIFILTLISIGVGYYFDYKNDKKYFKKSLLNVILLILIVVLVLSFNEFLTKLWNYIFK